MTTKTQVSWTSDELAVFKASLTEPIDVLLGLFPRHTRLAIRVQRRRLGGGCSAAERSRLARRVARNMNHDKKCKVDQSLTLADVGNVTWQVLIGSLLGDGGLKRNTGGRNRSTCRNYYFCTAHSEYQRPYVEWKREKLAIFHPSRVAKRRPEFSTCSHLIFTNLHPLVYSPQFTRRTDLIPELAYTGLDLLGLLVWFLDDGSCGFGPGVERKGRGCSLSIAAMSYGSVQLGRMAAVLNDRFGLSFYVKEQRWKDKMNYHLKIPYADWPVLLPVWKRLFSQHGIPSCMAYKVPA